jgi:hypothetical protein
MTKIRIIFFLITLLVVGSIGLFASYYARGYRLDFKTLKFQPNGILVLKSEPDGASVYINGELRTATNSSISLSPGTYDVEVRKDGYFSWYKRLTIVKEVVTQASSISLFKNVPSLSPVTSAGAVNPVTSDDGTKIAYTDDTGLWILDTISLPLGFTSGPKRITDGDMTGATYVFSPDGRQILVTISNGIFLLDTGSFVSQDQRVNVASKKDSILAGWQTEKAATDQNLIKNLPQEVADLLTTRTSSFTFSPDQTMVLYTASSAATLPDNLIAPLPGASTQPQQRSIQTGSTYVYDTKEDRNFFITDQASPIVMWMPTSRHLLYAQAGQVVVMDYDGTNKQIVYSGSYTFPDAFPYTNTTKILILTNLGASSSNTNLYTITVK